MFNTSICTLISVVCTLKSVHDFFVQTRKICYTVMSPKEKQATPQVAFVARHVEEAPVARPLIFLGPLTNGRPAIAGSRARKRGPVSETPGPFFFLDILHIRKYEQITDM